MVNTNGSPVTGPVQLKLDLYYSGDLSTLKCSKTFFGVPLKNGVFHVNVDYASSDCGNKPFSQIVQEIPDSETMALSVTDVTHSKTYSHHSVHSVPLSMLSAAAKTLTAPPAGTPSGHVLKWNGTAWEAAANSGGGGTVTGISAGTGINVTQNVNNYTVSIANGNPNEIRVNDAAGALSSISLLPLTMGGTGATTALGARTNLGLGTSAVANTGFANGNVLPADGIAYCLPGTKLNVTALPTVMWTCSPEDSDNTKLPLAGGTMTGSIDMGTNKISNLGTPTVGTDAATKAYVDSAASAASTSVWSLNGSDVYRSLGNVGVGTNTPQAVLDVTSTTSGVLVPRMTTAQRDAIAAPIAGMVLYNTSTSKMNFYDGAWKELGVSGAGITSINIGTGLTPAGAFTSGGTIAIAAGGVGSTELANSAVTDAKISGGVSRSKLASGTANHVLINDASGVVSSEASLAITRGGTGLTAPGTANQILGMNNAAGAMEYKSIVAGTGVSVAHTPNTITVSATGAPPTGAAGGDLSGTYPNPTLNTVPVSKGGTGLTSLTPRGVLSGDAAGTGVVGTACASGQYLGFNVSGDPTCYNVSNITANSFVNSGNDFGGDATLGTNGAGQALNFETAGTTKMSINAAGNIGIGTSTQTRKLQITQGGTDFFINPQGTVVDFGSAQTGLGFWVANSEKMRIDSSGKVGVGTTAPNYPLTVVSAGVSNAVANFQTRSAAEPLANNYLVSKNATLQVVGGDNNENHPGLISIVQPGYGSASARSGTFSLVSSRSTTAQLNAGTFTATQSNDELGTIMFGGDNTTNLRTRGAEIVGVSDGIWSATSSPGSLVFRTTPSGANTVTDVMRVTSTGRVGIGIANPNEKLTVNGVLSLGETTAPTATANYGKLYVKSTDSKLYFMDDGGNESPVGTPSAGSISSSMIQDGSIVDADVSPSAGIAQSKIANLTTDLAGKQASDPELTAVAGLSTDGIMVKSGAGSVVTRTIVGAAGRTFVSNGNGATGNPTVDISNGLLPSPAAGDAGKFLKASGADTSSWQALTSSDITTALGFTPINKATDTINSGTFTFGGTSVVRVLDPILPTDAANRQWVDSRISGSAFVNDGNDFGGNAVLGTNGVG